jgi:N-acetylglucosaminyldiphosphoundecaprenol N-acetyl-beta-D-mannosaminyltransferase
MKLSQQFPGIQVAGHYCPPFGFENDPSECRRILDSIAKSEADILFVALGAPKQEKWIWAYGPASGAKIAMAVGGSFSFVTGDLKRAPRLMQKYGFEWLWRLLNEPRRLWRRYLIEDTPFIWIVLKAWLRRRVFRNWTEYSC